MTWTKLTDTWCEDRVFDGLDHATRWHYLAMIQFCSRNERYDGVLRLTDARRCSDVDDPVDALGALILAGLVQRVDDTTVRVVRIGEHVPPPSVRNASAQTKVRTQRWRKHKNGDHSDCLPENCPNAGDAAGDASPRDGTGRAGTGNHTSAGESENDSSTNGISYRSEYRGGDPGQPREVVDESGNLVGFQVANPAENLQGQDRTGQEKGEWWETTTLDEGEVHVPEQWAEPPWRDDDPDYAGARADW